MDDGSCPANGVHKYTYDAEGQIATALYGSVVNGYGADGLRIAKQVSGGTPENFLYSFDGLLLAHQTGSTHGTQEIWVNGQHFAIVTPTSTPVFTLSATDWLGTERMRADASNNLQATFCNFPFGDSMTTCFGTDPLPTDTTHFTGKERDTESGNDYFGARYYASTMGRFLSPDPAGLTYAIAANPQSLNLYSYALNNPLRFTDPTGMYCFYGGAGDTPENDSDPTDYDFSATSSADCGSGAQWIDNPSTTVTVSGGGDNGNTLSTFPSDVSRNYQFIPGKGCSAALRTAGANSTAINNYYNLYQTPISNAGNANGVDPRLLAAIGVRESHLPADPAVIQRNGLGRGLFQIDLGAHPGVTAAQAFDPGYSANYAANLLSANRAALEAQHPNLDPVQLSQATAASYNFGTGNISGDPNTIDAKTTNDNYGSNVIAITLDCF